MDISVELSLYPLNDRYLPIIRDFIERLHAYGGLKIHTSSMSTQVTGEYSTVMNTLAAEMRHSLEASQKAVFVMKVLGPLTPA